MYQLGKRQYYDGLYNEAELNLKAGLQGYRQVAPPAVNRIYKSIYRLGKVYTKQRQYDAAIAQFREAEKLVAQEYGADSEEQADVLGELATIFSKNMQLDLAQEYNREAIAIYRQRFGAQSDEVANQYMHMAINDYKEGNYKRAEFHYTKAFQIFRKISKPEDENFNRIYSNMGMLYRKTGDLQKSLDYAQQALRIKLLNYPEDHLSVAKYHSNLGRVLLRMGRNEEAIAAFKRGMAISTKGLDPDHPELGGAYIDLADSYAEIGQYERSTEWYQKGTDILRKRLDENHPYVVGGAFNIAQNYMALGQYQEALDLLQPALERFSQRGQFMNLKIARAMGQIADAQAGLKQWDEALEMLQKALVRLDSQLSPTDYSKNPKARRVDDKFILLELLFNKATVLEQRFQGQPSTELSDLKAALATVERMKEIVLKLRKRYNSKSSQRYLNEITSPIFQLGVRVAYQLYEKSGKKRYQNAAFQYSELDRASLLWRTIQEQKALQWGAIPSEELDQLRTLRQQISKMEEEDFSQSLLLQEEYESLIARLEETHPQYYQLKYAPPNISLEDLAQRLPDAQTSILSYYYEGDQCYFFLIGPDGIKSKRQPLAPTLIPTIKELRALDIGNLFQASKTQQAVFNQQVQEVYQSLWQPVAQVLSSNTERIVVVPFAALSYLSFEMLFPPLTSREAKPEYLLERYAFSYAYSANLWGEKLRPQTAFQYDFIGFAPQYDTQNAEQEPPSEWYSYRESLNALPFAIKEIQDAQSYFKGPSLLHQEATETKFKDLAPQSRILHLAMHAHVNDLAPLQSSLYFQAVDSSEQEDGVLQLGEIYQLSLPADLAVISACNTGYGQLEKGEGVQSLANAFRFAGCQSMLTHLWPANDQASTKLIGYFYQALAKGEAKDVALRSAKLAYLRQADPLAAHPYFWAGLVLIGERKAIDFASSGKWWWGLWTLVFLGGIAWWFGPAISGPSRP